jgi:hypothetical protein
VAPLLHLQLSASKDKEAIMNFSFRRKTGSVTHVHQPDCKKESLPELFNLLNESLKRYGYLQKCGAPDVLLDTEKDLFCSRLLALSMELKKVGPGL